jgi:hypothetical protein
MNEPQFPQDAYQTLAGRVHAPVFFQKLANDYGVVAQTAEDQFELLELANMLRGARQEDQSRSSGTSFFKEAADNLRGALTEGGYGNVGPTSQDRLVKQAALEVIADPDIAGAALAYGHYLSQLESAHQG